MNIKLGALLSGFVSDFLSPVIATPWIIGVISGVLFDLQTEGFNNGAALAERS